MVVFCSLLHHLHSIQNQHNARLGQQALKKALGEDISEKITEEKLLGT